MLNQCPSGKQMHRERKNALKQVSHLRRLGPDRDKSDVDDLLGVYHCRTCKHYHVGHDTTVVTRRRDERMRRRQSEKRFRYAYE